jgi:hypothetical protein
VVCDSLAAINHRPIFAYGNQFCATGTITGYYYVVVTQHYDTYDRVLVYSNDYGATWTKVHLSFDCQTLCTGEDLNVSQIGDTVLIVPSSQYDYYTPQVIKYSRNSGSAVDAIDGFGTCTPDAVGGLAWYINGGTNPAYVGSGENNYIKISVASATIPTSTWVGDGDSTGTTQYWSGHKKLLGYNWSGGTGGGVLLMNGPSDVVRWGSTAGFSTPSVTGTLLKPSWNSSSLGIKLGDVQDGGNDAWVYINPQLTFN